MKKKLGILVVMLFVVCILTVCVGAKTVYASRNSSVGSALDIDFGDTAIVEGNMGNNISRYFRFYVPYNGIVSIDFSVSCTSGTGHSTYWTALDAVICNENSSLAKLATVDENYKYQSKSGSAQFSPGYYYLRIDNEFGNFSCSKITAVLTFQCSHIDTTENIIREATCSQEGYIEEICVECGEVADEYETDKLDHTPAADWTTTRETTCSEAGEKVKYCTVCSEEVDTEEIEALPHTWSEWKVTKETSCADEGEEQRECTVCKYVEEREIEILEHSYSEWEIVQKPTCADAGLRKRICSACGKEEKETVEKEEHSFGKWETTKESTCTEQGSKQRTCTACGEVEKEIIEKEDHRFGSWKTTKEASESSSGKKERTCNECEYVEEETIDRLVCGDEYDWVTTTKATCTSNGSKKKVCEYCGKTLSTQTVYAEGHEWGNWKTTREPTKTSSGVQQRKCEICGDTEQKSVTLTHGDYGEWKVTNEATCKEAGKKEFVCYCCNKTTKTQTISKTEHSYGDWVDEKTAAPDKDGLQTSTCKYCDNKKTKVVEYDFEGLKKEKRKAHGFSDVKPNAWYNDVVGNCYHYGLMVGNSETTFNPAGNITRAEVITSAVRIYCLTNPDVDKPQTDASPWYKGYVDYAIEKGIIKSDDYTDYTVPATRAEMAYIFANAVGEKNLEKINDVTSIPDVKDGDKYAKEIFSLYNAGVLTGSDDKGTFNPDKNIVRSESAAIIARISKISDRVKK